MTFEFCPTCAAPMTQQDSTTYQCANGHPFWNNAKAATAMVLYKDGQALFAERGTDPAKGRFDFPGGFVDFGESAEAAIRREMREEAGIEVGTLTLVGATNNNYAAGISTVDLVYFCTDWRGEIAAADDVAAFVWKPLEFIVSDAFAWPSYHELYDVIVGHARNA